MMDEQCGQIEALLPAYALGSLEAGDRWLVEAHLLDCPGCKGKLDGYGAASLGLLMAAPQMAPPAGLRARLIATISERPAHKKGWRDRFARRFLFASGAVALVGFIVLTGYLAIKVRDLASNQLQLTEQLQEDQTVFSLYSYPTTVSVVVEGEHGYGTFLYEPNLPVSVLYAWGLEALDKNATYQIWLIDPGGGRVSGGLFQVEAGARFVRLLVRAPEDISTYSAIGVTIEPAGGSEEPTGPKVLGADL